MGWLVEILLKLFAAFITRVFFRRVITDGLHNIPSDGAIIYVANHQNQFMDAALIAAEAPQTVSFLIAKKSFDAGGVVGTLAKAFGTIPVARPQDTAIVGTGTVSVEEHSLTVRGEGTAFTTVFKPNMSINIGKETIRVAVVESDTELTLSSNFKKDIPPSGYKIVPKIDQSEVYSEVWKTLGNKGCIGIFPEGGSHDRSDLLEIKAGVALMALGAAQRYKVTVYIVPVGLNYFSGHRFRSSTLVEFGKAYKVPRSLVKLSKHNRREACNVLLNKVKERLLSVITHAPDIDTLEVLQLARKLYIPAHVSLTSRDFLKLSHRLLEMYKQYKHTPQVQKLNTDLLAYRDSLVALGLNDRHVSETAVSLTKIVFLVFFRFCLVAMTVVLALPTTILNGPIGMLIRYKVRGAAEKAVSNSAVKIKGLDVLASKKVVTALSLIPPIWTLYILIFMYYFGVKYAVIFGVTLPFFSYLGLMLAEEGMANAISLMAILRIKWIGSEVARIRQKRVAITRSIRLVFAELGRKIAELEGIKTAEEFEEWRIITDAMLESEAMGMDESYRASASRGPRFKEEEPLHALINDDEWNDLKDVWS